MKENKIFQKKILIFSLFLIKKFIFAKERIAMKRIISTGTGTTTATTGTMLYRGCCVL